MDSYEAFLCELADKYGVLQKIRSAIRYFVWIAGNQGVPTEVSHGGKILYYFL